MRREITIMAVIALAVVGFGVLLFLNDKTETGEPVVSGVNTEGAHFLGSADAKVTIVEFADMQCPACARSVAKLHEIVEKSNGQVRLVFKHFPLSQHRNAMPAAQAVEAAGEQGKFWEMYDLLYITQTQWQDLSNPRDFLMSAADSLGLNMEQFGYSLDTRKYLDKILTDQREGDGLNINATPTFFVNGEKYVGVPDSNFEDLINSKLNN